ncbi:MAG: uracil-DNA glycosylase [Candidatus Nanopelagicaceae bacterium]
MKYRSLKMLDQDLIKCTACPRLVEWREEVAITKRKSYLDQEYWGRPVPGFGALKPKILVVGLAPGAHGANRTGRIFTGDSSGDWLYRSLHKNRLASLPTSTSKDDGQVLFDTRITCAVHCAPPDNKPTTDERDQCASWFNAEIGLAYPSLRAIVALGAFGWNAVVRALVNSFDVKEFIDSKGGIERNPRFAHAARFEWRDETGNSRVLLGSYHPSQQNTFTGKLTEAMLDRVFEQASRFAR